MAKTIGGFSKDEVQGSGGTLGGNIGERTHAMVNLSPPSMPVDKTKYNPPPPEAPQEMDPETGHPYGILNSLAKGINSAVDAVTPELKAGYISKMVRGDNSDN